MNNATALDNLNVFVPLLLTLLRLINRNHFIYNLSVPFLYAVIVNGFVAYYDLYFCRRTCCSMYSRNRFTSSALGAGNAVFFCAGLTFP